MWEGGPRLSWAKVLRWFDHAQVGAMWHRPCGRGSAAQRALPEIAEVYRARRGAQVDRSH